LIYHDIYLRPWPADMALTSIMGIDGR